MLYTAVNTLAVVEEASTWLDLKFNLNRRYHGLFKIAVNNSPLLTKN